MFADQPAPAWWRCHPPKHNGQSPDDQRRGNRLAARRHRHRPLPSRGRLRPLRSSGRWNTSAARLERDLHASAGLAAPHRTSSLSGLLRDSAHVRQARSRCLRCCPGMTVTALGRPPHRAHGGHAHGSGGRFWDLANSARCVNGLDWITHPPDGKFIPRIFRIMGTCTVTARTVQGMARVRPGRLLPDPYLLVRSVRRGSRVKRDFACTFTWLLSPVLVVLRSQSRLRLEGADAYAQRGHPRI